MLEYSHGYWHSHHGDNSNLIQLIQQYKWWWIGFVIGIIFVGISLFSEPSSEVGTFELPQTIQESLKQDVWTRSDGEIGAFEVVKKIDPSPIKIGSQYVTLPGAGVETTPLFPLELDSGIKFIPEIIVPRLQAVYFEEPVFLCDYLSHPWLFSHCKKMGDKEFFQAYVNKEQASRKLNVRVLEQIFLQTEKTNDDFAEAIGIIRI